MTLLCAISVTTWRHCGMCDVLMLCVCPLQLQACADKLNRELDTYGCPPKFPTEDEPEVRTVKGGGGGGEKGAGGGG